MRLLVALSLAVVAAPLAAEDLPSAWDVSCGARLTDSAEPSAWCWRDHSGERWTVRSEASLGLVSEELVGSVLIAQRRDLGLGWWLGFGSEWSWDQGSSQWRDRLVLEAGRSDERSDGHGQAVSLRLLGPDSSEREEHGVLGRWESLYPRWLVAVEVLQVAYTNPPAEPGLDPDREWDRSVAILVGRRWRPAVAGAGEQP